MFSAAMSLAAFDWSKHGTLVIAAVSMILIMLLISHFFAAKLVIPDATAGRIFGAFALYVGLTIIAIPMTFLVDVFVPTMSLVAALVVLAVGGAASASIFKVSLLRGISYNLVVAAGLFGLMWASKQIFSSKYGPLPLLVGRGGKERAGELSAPADSARYASVLDAQAAAVREYPELGKAGSAFNKRFLEKHRAYKERNDPILQSPGWPVVVAREVAAEMPR